MAGSIKNVYIAMWFKIKAPKTTGKVIFTGYEFSFFAADEIFCAVVAVS